MQMTNQKGFTLSETLLSLVIILMIMSISFPWFSMFRSTDYYNELSAHQFFIFLQEQINSSRGVDANSRTLKITDRYQRSVTIEQYGDLIRRQVNGTGHEELLQEVEYIRFQKSSAVLIIMLTMKGGISYKRNILLPSSQ